ncbi:G-protein coupled receptor 151 [Carettochelys insculpta]|uniref:G-protein coupled receptor 151 n=1 Tax=Carettochelys insculpta TaxID=44489 RepID=UPI003EB7A57A
MNSSLAPQAPFAGGSQPHDSRAWKAAIPALLGVVCLAGVAGNACVLGLLLSSARRGKPSLIHSLILNLSLADLLLLLFAAPLRAAAYSRSAWSLGWFVCKTSDGFSRTCMAAKSLTTAVAAKACFAYASNPAKQVSIEPRAICALLLATWLAALVSSLPLWLFSSLREPPVAAGSAACVVAVPAPAREFMAAFVNLYPLLVFGAPLLCAFLYFWRAYGRCQRRGTKTQNLRNQIRSRRLTVMLLSVAVTLAVLWLPEWIAWLWVWHLKPASPAPPEGFLALTQVLMFTSSSADPLIFLVMSEEFREGFKGLWKRLTLEKPLPAADNQEIPAAKADVLSDSVPSPEPVIAEQEKEAAPQATESLESKELPVFPDVEQFWHDREAAPDAQDNDPVPWEHEEQETVGCNK